MSVVPVPGLVLSTHLDRGQSGGCKDARGQRRFPRVCFEVYRDGQYRISRATLRGTENLGGKLTPGQLNLLANLLKKVGFENKGGGIVWQGSETLVAEIARDDEPAGNSSGRFFGHPFGCPNSDHGQLIL